MEEVREILHAAVQFATAMHDVVEKNDTERFRSVFAEMAKSLPVWQRCDQRCE
jgi:hypothetical protein